MGAGVILNALYSTRTELKVLKSKQEDEIDPYRALGCAVCEQAFMDLIDAYTYEKADALGLDMTPLRPGKKILSKRSPDLERFIRSWEWISRFSGENVVEAKSIRSCYNVWPQRDAEENQELSCFIGSLDADAKVVLSELRTRYFKWKLHKKCKDLEDFICSSDWTLYSNMTNGESVIAVARVRADYNVWRLEHGCYKCRIRCFGRQASGWSKWLDEMFSCRKEEKE